MIWPGHRLLAAVLTAAIALGRPAAAPAFHQEGTANCSGCHTTHDSQDGRPVAPAAAGEWALLAERPSEVCLMCHAAAFGEVLGSSPLAPPPEMGGGNFVFLLEDDLNDAADGLTNPIAGHAAGHNLDAPAYGLAPDPRYSFSPGGSFPADAMGCTSCHDPHGGGNFRMLHGAGPVLAGRFSFAAPAPKAVGIALDSAGESRTNHSAYREGVSAWCGNCHGRYHDTESSDFEHPADETLGGSERDRYNRYDGDARPDSGFPSTAYLPEVPFEDDALSVDSTFGPSAASRVMCLTCHRAHGSSAPSAGRWDFNVTLLEDDGIVSGSYPMPSPYADVGQGTLCAKCHEGGAPD